MWQVVTGLGPITPHWMSHLLCWSIWQTHNWASADAPQGQGWIHLWYSRLILTINLILFLILIRIRVIQMKSLLALLCITHAKPVGGGVFCDELQCSIIAHACFWNVVFCHTCMDTQTFSNLYAFESISVSFSFLSLAALFLFFTPHSSVDTAVSI